MKVKEIQELLDFIAQSGLAEVNIETEQFKLAVKKYEQNQVSFTQPVYQQQGSVVQHTPPTATGQQDTKAADTAAVPTGVPAVEESSNLITIKSPMIGTFYRSASPESPFFVNVGDEIKIGQTVCIIEAMKLFNEIESEVSGRIVKILVENSSPVEYDQPLFLVEPK